MQRRHADAMLLSLHADGCRAIDAMLACRLSAGGYMLRYDICCFFPILQSFCCMIGLLLFVGLLPFDARVLLFTRVAVTCQVWYHTLALPCHL